MKYLPGHLKKKLSRWKGKKWYHQRFDGCPYFLHFIAEAEIAAEERKRGGENEVHYCFFQDGKADWYILMDDIERISGNVLREGKKDPHISKTLMQAWREDERAFDAMMERIAKTDLASLDDAALLSLQKSYTDAAYARFSSSSVIDGFALGTDELIAEKIRKLYDASSLKERMKFTEVFSILTAPVHLSFINEAEVSLLGAKGSEDRLRAHQQAYFWIHNNYVSAHVLSLEQFREELEKLGSLDVEKEALSIRETPLRNRKKKEALMKGLSVAEELRLLIEVSEDFTRWQDERKKATFLNIHYGSMLLGEVAKRKGIPLGEAKYLTPTELFSPPSRDVLRERRKNSAYYWDGQGMECVHGKDADDVKQAILGTLDLSDVDDFRGLTACLGKATGTVKVIRSATEIGKVEQGDILVAVMTRPDYVPAMRKAAAIVTDEGGVTCHAAIVSRELNIPCIIATKIATKVLKDGQRVEVNANHSWVRILR